MVDNLEIILRPSGWLLGVVVGLHLLAIVALWLSAIFLIMKFMILIFMIFCCYYIGKYRIMLCGRKAIVRLWFSGSEWVLFDKVGNKYRVKLLKDNFVSSLIIILSFKSQDQWFKKYVVLCRDAIDYQQFRRLKVLLLVKLRSNLL